MSANPKLTPSPYINFDVNKHTLYTSPTAGFRPLKDGSYPLMPYIYSNWIDEELSWHDNCYIHAGLNPFVFQYYKGEDFLRLMTDFTVNTFKKFPVGKARHVIRTDENGKVNIDGIVMHIRENEFVSCCFFSDILQMFSDKYNIEYKDLTPDRAFYQLCGPKSLEIVEAAIEEDIHDLGFMYGCFAKIQGKEVYILRTGMAGTLGYEVHCDNKDASMVYETLLTVGKEYGIRELGAQPYWNAHTEGSIPQSNQHYGCPMFPLPYTGSLEQGSELFYRSPYDLGWGNLVKFDHDFPGKDILLKEYEGHHNDCVHLIWNSEDILKVIATYFTDDPADLMNMDGYYDAATSLQMCIDKVYDGDKFIGVSSGRMLSPKNHEMISLATIDQDYVVEGKEVEVLWGRPGTRQMRIRATVMLFPYIKEGRNDNIDIEIIPHKFDKKR